MAKRKKTGGRQPGSKNKKTLAKKEELEKLFHENGGFKKLFNTIEAIEEPKDKASALVKVMKFFMAEQKAVEHKGDNALGTIVVNFDSTSTMPPITSENDMFDDD